MDWAQSLSPTARNRVFNRVYRLQAGNLGDYKRISQGLFELRLFFDGGFRVYFGRDGDQFILLLCGGDKSSQKKDIEKAKEYWNEYNGQKK